MMKSIMLSKTMCFVFGMVVLSHAVTKDVSTEEGEKLVTAAATNTQFGNPYYNPQYDYNPYYNKAGYNDAAYPSAYNNRYYNARSYPGYYDNNYYPSAYNNSRYAGYPGYNPGYNPYYSGNQYYNNNQYHRGYPNAYNNIYPEYNSAKYYDPRYQATAGYNRYNDPRYNADYNRYNQFNYDSKYPSASDYNRYNRQYDPYGAYNFNYPYSQANAAKNSV